MLMKYFKNKAGLKVLSLSIPFAEGLILKRKQTEQSHVSPSLTAAPEGKHALHLLLSGLLSFTSLSSEDSAVSPHRFLSPRIIFPHISHASKTICQPRLFLFHLLSYLPQLLTFTAHIHSDLWWHILWGRGGRCMVLALGSRASSQRR